MGPTKIFERIYLHVGLGKTGSSSIQRAAVGQHDQLLDVHGIHFPLIDGDPRPFNGNHTLFLSSLFGSKPELQRPNQLYGLGSYDAISKANEDVLRQFEQGFLATSATKLLLSAEGVGHYSRGRMQRLADWLYTFTSDVRVVACLRNPIDALSSEIQQRLKTGAILENLYRDPPHYSYRTVLTDLESVFGRSSFLLYDYADAIESRGGLVAEFFRQIGLSLSGMDEVLDGEVVNTSMSQEGALLLSALNRQRPLFVNGSVNPSRSPEDVLEFISIPGKKYQAPEWVYRQLRSQVEPELAWLYSNYGLILRELKSLRPNPLSRQWSEQSIDALALKLNDLGRLRRA
ncbi:hypothetical protein H2508_14285 [Parahaliea sp. F7430]|uniref:Sulfotransferase family protein n=1 Tax=Sediminihaliea albiluteola TaxID=2758564 RepID=A0A7W2TYG1_9GAMM|nr:hypothetical protein [Sediminihaliea albiluteola]MBA6414280.1 hypothetical protein [Sediminihaliea albiluteola]